MNVTEDARLPHCIIGGAPRSGTTFLCHVLEKHPDVHVARPYIPEPKVCLTPSPDGPAGYRARYARLFANAPAGTVLVEKTSNYLENADALERLRAALDSVRFVFILREPVARAFSNYLWSKQNGLETLSFAEAVELELAGQHRASPLPPDRPYARPFDYLARGDYGTFAERYYRAFGRESVGFLLFEEIRIRPDRLYRRLQELVQVDPLSRERLETGAVNQVTESQPLDPRLEAALREHMRPMVERFAAITGLDVGPWRY